MVYFKISMTGVALIIAILIMLFGFSQHKMTTEPPILKNGQRLHKTLLLGYRGDIDSFKVITIKFKITASGVLDTLHISNNAPKDFRIKAIQQLTNLNGKWTPQKADGRPVKSKWIVSHYYIAGYRESSNDFIKQIQQNFFEAYKREEELFLCNKMASPSVKCYIDYVEGYDLYLTPPLLSNTLR